MPEPGEFARADLAREDDVFFRPGVHAIAMVAGHLARLELCFRPGFFFHHLTGEREFSSRGTTDENAFGHGFSCKNRGAEQRRAEERPLSGIAAKRQYSSLGAGYKTNDTISLAAR